METETLTGFWSYTRIDARNSGGRLDVLRDLVEKAAQFPYGQRPRVKLWHDTSSTPYGADWKTTIRAAVARSMFFVPIVTPAFLQSQWCCEEVRLFLAREAEFGRSDLIFPIFYFDIGRVDRNDSEQCADRDIYDLLSKRQGMKFEHLRNVAFTDALVLAEVDRLALCIHGATASVFAATVRRERERVRLEEAEETRKREAEAARIESERVESELRSEAQRLAHADASPKQEGLEAEPVARASDRSQPVQEARQGAVSRRERIRGRGDRAAYAEAAGRSAATVMEAENQKRAAGLNSEPVQRQAAVTAAETSIDVPLAKDTSDRPPIEPDIPAPIVSPKAREASVWTAHKDLLELLIVLVVALALPGFISAIFSGLWAQRIFLILALGLGVIYCRAEHKPLTRFFWPAVLVFGWCVGVSCLVDLAFGRLMSYIYTMELFDQIVGWIVRTKRAAFLWLASWVAEAANSVLAWLK